MKKSTPSIKRLRDVLRYDPATGKLFWKAKTSIYSPIKVGDEAGTLDGAGYIKIVVDFRQLRAHRVIWAMQTGRWPKIDVDHEDRDKSNNRWGNLREANDSQNRANAKRSVTNSTGFKGAGRNRDRFRAQICFQGKAVSLGTHDTPEEAHAAYIAKAKELFGKFARAS